MPDHAGVLQGGYAGAAGGGAGPLGGLLPGLDVSRPPAPFPGGFAPRPPLTDLYATAPCLGRTPQPVGVTASGHVPRRRGSRTSRRASPKRANAKVTMARARPG